MRLRSFIVTVVALFVIANAIVAAIKRCGLDLAVEGGETTHPEAPMLSGPVGIEGLSLQLSRPLMCTVGQLGGVAASERWLYVASWDVAGGAAQVLRLDAASYDVALARTLEEEGAIGVGGIDVGAALVWVPLVVVDGTPQTVVLGLDAETLDVAQRFRVPGDVGALAEGLDGRVYGVSHDGAHWTVWRPDGAVSREATGPGGVRYTDLAVARGSLLAAGSDGVSGVIDVIEPTGLSLLARYHVEVGAEASDAATAAWVTSGGLAVRDEGILLLPRGGARPSLLHYVARNGGLEAFAPSVYDAISPARPTAAP